MVFEQPKWSCDSCGERREEQFMSIQHRTVITGAGDNIRPRTISMMYCNDRPQCLADVQCQLDERKRQVEASEVVGDE